VFPETEVYVTIEARIYTQTQTHMETATFMIAMQLPTCEETPEAMEFLVKPVKNLHYWTG
jgi:hypothetical protein